MMAADSLYAGVHCLVLSGVAFCRPSPCRCACSADAFALHFALHLGLHSMQPSNVQASSLEHGRPAAVAVFVWAPVAHAAAPPGRRGRERMREANAEGKIKGRGTTVREKPVCTWVGGGTPPGARSCRQSPQCLAGIGEFACFARRTALLLDGAAS